MSTSHPFSAKRPRVRLENDINTDERAKYSEDNTHPILASDTVEIYRREGRTEAEPEIDEDRDGSHQKRQSRKRRSQSPSHGISN